MTEGLRPAAPDDGLAQRRLDLRRIHDALDAAVALTRRLAFQGLALEFKLQRNDPVTIVDRSINELLRQQLPQPDEGWLSEETSDDRSRLGKRRVWVVDPLDGTREFVNHIPEWCISIGLVEEGRAVAGGICNPATGELFLGALGLGVTTNGQATSPRLCATVGWAVVLASRSEVERGEWKHCLHDRFCVQPMGSVAYKLARVAAGLADATWTFLPKHEWDVAAGVALVIAAGGAVSTPDCRPPIFNSEVPIFPGLMAFSASGQRLLEPLALEGWHRAGALAVAGS